MRTCLLAALLTSALAAAPAHADTLYGSDISQVFTVPASDTDLSQTKIGPPSAIVGPGVEFSGKVRDAAFHNIFTTTADFTTDTLMLNFSSIHPASNVLADDLGSLIFSGFSSSVTGFSLSGYFYSGYFSNADIPSGISSVTYMDSTLDLTLDNIFAGQTYVFTAEGLSTPEPATLALLGTGLLGLTSTLRRSVKR